MLALDGIHHVTVGRVILKQPTVQEMICQVRGRETLLVEGCMYVLCHLGSPSFGCRRLCESSEEKHRAVLTARRSPPSLSYCHRAAFRVVNVFFLI